MPRFTLYLDPATADWVQRAAKASKLSRSRWVAELIHRHATGTWSPELLALPGRFDDFPLRKAESAEAAADVARLDF